MWATGQFFSPRDQAFPGANWRSSSKVNDWNELEGDEFTVIGGYESGLDAALNLVDLGKSVSLHSRENLGVPMIPTPRVRSVLALSIDFGKSCNPPKNPKNLSFSKTPISAVSKRAKAGGHSLTKMKSPRFRILVGFLRMDFIPVSNRSNHSLPMTRTICPFSVKRPMSPPALQAFSIPAPLWFIAIPCFASSTSSGPVLA